MNSLLNSDDRIGPLYAVHRGAIERPLLVGTMQQVIDEGPIALVAATLVETAGERSRIRLSTSHGIECKKI